MIRALAIETSGRIGSVALARDGVVAAEQTFEHGLRHAAQILPIIDGLTRGQGWAPGELNEIYVSTGPGSFTGLRIGITLAKTLAFATGAKIVAAPTVRVLAENGPAEAERMIVVLDAKRGEDFTALLERDATAGWVEREGAHLDTLGKMLARAGRPVHLLGEGIPYHEKEIPSNDPQIILTAPEFWRARAGAVCRIGWSMSRAGEFTDPMRLTPLYIRRPEPEEKLDSAIMH